jgi:flavodoxin
MNSLVVYESKFGNTHRVADIIGRALGSYGSAPVVDIESADAFKLDKVDLLVVGGPTQAHGMSPPMRAYLDALITKAGTGMRAAAFDTRLKGPGFLWGSAAKGIAEEFRRAGFLLVTPPESFLVEGMKEPQLVDGEATRAQGWATQLGSQVASQPAVTI